MSDLEARHTDTRPDRSRRLWQSASQGLLIIWIWGLGAMALSIMYGDARQQAFQWADSLTAVMSRSIKSQAESLERRLLAQANLLGRHLSETDAPAEQLFSILRPAQLTDPAIGILFIADRNGDIVASSRSPQAPKHNISGQDYFEAHRRQILGGAYISHVAHSQFAHDLGTPSMVYSVRLQNEQGTLLGVLVAYVNEQPIVSMYRSFQLDEQGEARLLRGDGSLLLADSGPADTLQRYNLGLLQPDTAWRNGYVGSIGNDAQSRFYVIRHIPEYNLITLVGLNQQAYLARWYQFLLFGGLTLIAMTSYITLQWQRQKRLWQNQDQNQERLIEAERKIAGLLDSVPDAVWSITPDRSKLRYLSPSASRLYGFSHEEFIASPDKWMERIVEDDRQELTHDLAATQFRPNEQFEHTYRIRIGETIRWIKHRAWGVHNAHGVLLSIDSLASDVSEQLNSLHSLQEREQELQALLDGMPLGAMFFKDNHCYANPAASELLGPRLQANLTPVELFTMLKPEKKSAEDISRLSSTPFTCTLLEPGKPIRFLRISWQFIARGNLWLLQDVTDSERQARLSSEVEAAANVGGWELDLRNGEFLWSPQMYRLQQQDPKHFTPKPDNVFKSLTAESRARLRDASDNALMAGGEFNLDLDMSRADGHICNVHLVAKVQWHEGQPIRWYGSLQDISERVQATRAIEHQTQILNAAEQIAGMGSWEWQPASDRVAWSQGAYSLHSQIAAEMGDELQAWIERVHPSEREKMSSMLGQARNSQAPLSWHYHTLDAKLQWREIVVNTLPELNERGQVRVVRGTLHDVTETQALHAALQLRNRAIESLSSGVVIIDVSLDTQPIIYASPAVSVITGYSQDELLQKNGFNLLLGDDTQQAEVKLMNNAIHRREAIQLTLRNYRKDGSMFWNETGLAPVTGTEGVIQHYIGIMTDVSARRRSEEMLLEMQQRLRSILNTAADAIVVIDQRGHVQLFSHAAEKIFGYTSDEVLGHNVAMLMPEPLASEHDSYLSRYVHSGEPKVLGFGRELTGRRKDGSLVPIELAVSDWKSGNEMFFTGVIRDVTDQRKLQEQLLQSQKLDALGQLAGGIAHDFNNLLGVIVGNLDILAALLAEQPANLKRVNTALQAAERGASLTKRLLGFARTGATVTERLPVLDLNQIIRDIVDLIGKPLDPRIEFSLALTPEELPVRLDPVELQNALLNLVLNARDAMPDGGYLSVETSSLTVFDNKPDLAAGKYAQISVSDSGQGIPPAERARIFEPFYTTKPKGKGTGLGLSMVYSFVKRQQGAIRLDSEPGKGTTFELLFPCAVAVIDPRPSEPRQHHGQGKLILLVDDELALLDTVADQLEALGYRTLRENDPERAQRLLSQRSDIDLLFTDILMPRLSGTELARYARNLHPALPILLSTGFPDQYRTDELLNLPKVRLLAKPVPRARLIDALQQLLPSAENPAA